MNLIEDTHAGYPKATLSQAAHLAIQASARCRLPHNYQTVALEFTSRLPPHNQAASDQQRQPDDFV